MIAALAGLSCLIWLYLLLARGGFWQAKPRLDGADAGDVADWPTVVAIVPARDEAAVIGRALVSVLRQDYPGALSVILVDDHSSDDTASVARRAAVAAGSAGRLTILGARPLPPGWAGKPWALSEGIDSATSATPGARFFWLTDADIEHDSHSLRRLVAKAEQGDRDLVSVMVMLTCTSLWERLLIPPFVFFFQLLYPFPWANRPGHATAAAAGGCVLVRRAALEHAGGLASIRGALIDDCALAARIKKHGRPAGASIWLGLTDTLHSIRPYDGLGDIWRMVARTAYTQLRHSPLLLAGALAGMVVTYLVPPVITLTAPLHGSPSATILALTAWAMMSLALWPTLSLYRQPALMAPLLPLAAVVYCAMTVSSALAYARGRGGTWKGRAGASAGDPGRGDLPRASS